MLHSRLLEILVCPVCKNQLIYDKVTNKLICKLDRLAYPIENDIPIMLEEKAKTIS